MDLASFHCEACRPDSPQVPPEDEPALLASIPEWKLAEVNGVKRLKRTYRVQGWMPAVAFANQVAEIADQEDHHPSITIQWGRVTVQWWTHAIKGLHRNDFIMAAKTDTLAADH